MACCNCSVKVLLSDGVGRSASKREWAVKASLTELWIRRAISAFQGFQGCQPGLIAGRLGRPQVYVFKLQSLCVAKAFIRGKHYWQLATS